MAVKAVGLQTHIWNNNARSLMMLCAYPVLILLIIWLCVFVTIGMTQDFTGQSSQYGGGWPKSQIAQQTWHYTLQYVPYILGGIAIWFIIAYFAHSKMIMKMSGAHSLSRKEEPELYNMLENLCIAEGMPMPALNIIETHGRNAFASGINTQSYAVTVTRGLMNSLARDELEAVIAHELSHIKHRDVRLLMVTIIFTGMIGFFFHMMMNYFRYGIGRIRLGGRNKNQGGMVIIGLAIFAILGAGYMLTSAMRFFISRKREYMADAGAVDMTKNPEAMMRALMRISGRDHIPKVSTDMAMMYIENKRKFMGIFATHPPIEKRIEALALTNNIPVPEIKSLAPSPKSKQVPHRPKPSRGNPWLAQKRRSSQELWSSFETD